MGAGRDRLELVTLRVSVARVAQAAGVSLAPIGVADDADYGTLFRTANTVERGWNALAGDAADRAVRALEFYKACGHTPGVNREG